MGYCALEDLLHMMQESELIHLTDDGDLGAVDAGVVTRAIADADATIDAYLMGRYTVPLSTVPDKIRQVSVDLAVYNLQSRLDRVTDIRKDRKADAIRFLEAAASGKVDLGLATVAEANTDNTVDIENSTRIFTRDKMSGW